MRRALSILVLMAAAAAIMAIASGSASTPSCRQMLAKCCSSMAAGTRSTPSPRFKDTSGGGGLAPDRG